MSLEQEEWRGSKGGNSTGDSARYRAQPDAGFEVLVQRESEVLDDLEDAQPQAIAQQLVSQSWDQPAVDRQGTVKACYRVQRLGYVPVYGAYFLRSLCNGAR